MRLFRLTGKSASEIQTNTVKRKEDFIHDVVEGNLQRFFPGCFLIAREPRIGGRIFDTLAYDAKAKVPVILEYKRDKNRDVVEQVDRYYAKLRVYVKDIMPLFQSAVDDLKQIDFANPQIIVVAREFNPEQREVLSLKEAYLRLFTYQLFERDLLVLNKVEPLGLPAITSDRSVGAGAPSPFGYDLEHFGMKEKTLRLYEALEKQIRKIDSRIRPGKINKEFVGFGASGPYFANVTPGVNSLRIGVKYTNRPRKVSGLKLSSSPKYRVMTHYFTLQSQKHLKGAITLIKEAFERTL